MFNFQEAQDLTKVKKVQESSVVVLSAGRIKLNSQTIDLLDLKNKKVHILKDNSGNIVIGSVAETNDAGKNINEQGAFSNKNLASSLGGQYSEWDVVGNPITNPITGDIYYSLTEVVNGKAKRSELNEAAGITESTTMSLEEDLEEDVDQEGFEKISNEDNFLN